MVPSMERLFEFDGQEIIVFVASRLSLRARNFPDEVIFSTSQPLLTKVLSIFFVI